MVAAGFSGAAAGALAVGGGAGFESRAVAADDELGRGCDDEVEEQLGEALEQVIGVRGMGGGHELLGELLCGGRRRGGLGREGVLLAFPLPSALVRLGLCAARFLVFGPRSLGAPALEGGRACAVPAGAVLDGPVVQAVQEVVQGADAGAVFLVGVDAAQDQEHAGGLELGDPGVDAGPPQQDGEQQAAQDDQGVPGVAPPRALGIAAQEDGPRGLEVEVPEDLEGRGAEPAGIEARRPTNAASCGEPARRAPRG